MCSAVNMENFVETVWTVKQADVTGLRVNVVDAYYLRSRYDNSLWVK